MSQLVPSDPNKPGRNLDFFNASGNASSGTPGIGYAEVPPKELDLRALVVSLRRHLLLVLGVTFGFLLAAAYFVFTEIPEYRARATVRVADTRRAIAGDIEAGSVGQLIGKTTDPLISHIQVLRSRAVIARVVSNNGFQLRSLTRDFGHRYLSDVRVATDAGIDTISLSFGPKTYTADRSTPVPYGAAVRTRWAEFVVTAKPTMDMAELQILDQETAVDGILDNLTTTRRENTDIVDVEFLSPDPDRASAVANAVIETFRAYNTELAQQQSKRRRVFVQEQLSQTDSMLSVAQRALSDFRSSRQLYSSRDRLAGGQSGLMSIEMRREELAAEKRMFDQLLRRTPMSSDALNTLLSSPGMSANPLIVQLSQQLAGYQMRRDSLTAGSFGAARTNPDVARLDTLISTTRAKIVAAAGSYIQSINARLSALDDLKARTAGTMATLPATESEEMTLVQQVETTRKIADQLREEYQRARIAEAVEVGQVELLDLASRPRKPVPTRGALKLALALLVGLTFGSGAAMLRERVNTAIRGREDVEEFLGISNLAVVPSIFAKPNRRSLAFRSSNKAIARADRLVSVRDHRSTSAEAYRTLRTNLLFSQMSGRISRVAVTSASAAEGKTTTAANLAVTYAQQGISVLLIDCDLRKAQLHNVFGLQREPGFTDAVLGRVKIEQVIREGPVPGLSVICAGILPPNPAEVLGSQGAKETLDSLNLLADIIIIDAPPVLVAADAAVISTLVDGVVIVIRAGKTDRGAARLALQQLNNVGARVLGSVLNDPDSEMQRYGYYYNYSYYGDEA